MLGPAGEHLDRASLLDRHGEHLWLLAVPGANGPGGGGEGTGEPLSWLLRAAWRRAAGDPATAQRPVLVDLAALAADGPVTADAVLRAVTAGEAPPHGYLALVTGLDTAGGAVRAAVAGLSGPLARLAPASTIVTLSHAEPVPGFHVPAVVAPDAPPVLTGARTEPAAWNDLAARLRIQRPWPAALLAAAVTACAGAPDALRWRILDDLAALPDRRLLFRAALAGNACDDDGVLRAARTEIESLAGTPASARDPLWLSRLLCVLPVLDAAAPAAHDTAPAAGRPAEPPAGRAAASGAMAADQASEHGAAAPPARAVLLRLNATGRPGAAPLALLARRDPAGAIAAAEESGDPLDLDAVARAADDRAVLRAILGRCAAVPGWETALVYRAQLQPGVAAALLAGRDTGPGAGPVPAGRWRGYRLTRGTVYGRLLDDVLARPWSWPPYAAPLLFTLRRIRPPATVAPVVTATLPGAAGAALVAALLVLAVERLTAGPIAPAAASVAVAAGLAAAAGVLARRLRAWRAPVPGADPAETANSTTETTPTGVTPCRLHAPHPPTPGAAAAETGNDQAETAPAGIAEDQIVTTSECARCERVVGVRREYVLAGVLGLGGLRLAGVVPGRVAVDERLRRACVRAGVPEAEIAHLLRVLAARRGAHGAAPVVPEQAFRTDEREPSGG
ncbi:hypothetical protein [Dactylosporangium sp. CA-092794]|uniref:hypothetical protein n=1 Tax=Dactylosporangium sp. CA-092794 TaxID=3239929 RepID=UPI003D91055F